EVLTGEAVDLAEDRLRGVEVDVGERAGAEDLVAAEHLEQVELDVADVALVVAHFASFVGSASRGAAGDGPFARSLTDPPFPTRTRRRASADRQYATCR